LFLFSKGENQTFSNPSSFGYELEHFSVVYLNFQKLIFNFLDVQFGSFDGFLMVLS